MKKLLLTAILPALAALGAAAQEAPTVKISVGSTDGYIRRISDNGKWGVLEKSGTVEGSITPGGGRIINLETLASTDISDASGLSGVADVTNDGTIAVGECKTLPAYYSTVDKTWHTLPLPAGAFGGRLETVTPDGKYAAGYILSKATVVGQDFDSYSPVMYDLTTGTEIALPGMPVLDMMGETHNMTTIADMSPDGRYLIGRVSQSYIMPPGIFSYVYDRETATYEAIGFDITKPNENKASHPGLWTPAQPYTWFCDFPYMAAGGEWIVGTAHMVEPIAGSEWPKEYEAVYRYNIKTKEYICYNANSSEENIDGNAALSDGTVTASTPTASPYADAMVRSGNYFITLDQILDQVYGVNFADKTGWENTGKIIAVSEDMKTAITLVGPQNTFILHFSEPLSESAAKVDLMKDYAVTPAPNTVMSQLKTFQVRFDRDIVVNKAASNIKFESVDGNDSWSALSASVTSDAPSTLKITFRTRDLAADKNYVLKIPAGMVSIKGDAKYTSGLIEVPFKGHDNVPMALKNIYPEDGATVGYLDLDNNPITLVFDVDLAYGANPEAYLYIEGEEEPYSAISFSIGGSLAMLYPLARVNLYQGTDYKLVVKAGSLTDITGGCPNEEITLHWHGSYVRELNPDDLYLFKEECDNFANFMLYDGDRNTPAATAVDWGFTSSIPWWVTRDSEEDSDMAFCSHSMYSPKGKSDDWLVIPQLFIPDEKCYLDFDAQGYLENKEDFLKVIVYECDNVYGTITKSIADDMREKGEVVFNERLLPGEFEEYLWGDWTNHIIDLSKYAGKNIYIAFVNENENQSAIFLDNIKVVHNMKYLVTLENKSNVVKQNEIEIKGNITVASEIDTYQNATLTLKDAQGYEVSKIREAGLNLSQGKNYNFTFPNKLPLTAGIANKFSIEIALDEDQTIVAGEIKNLMFHPMKRVVLEEYSGRDCGNCPIGILAIENLEKLYPERVLPIVIRTYQGDPLGNTVTGYSSYLGMEQVGAPSGRVNRSRVLAPMAQINGSYLFSGAIANDVLWQDQVAKELAEPAEAAISFTSNYNVLKNTATVKATVKNAINASNVNYNLFAVVVENNVDGGYQSNYFANVQDPNLGDWGKGGQYAKSYVIPYTCNEVARTTWGNTYQGTGGLIPTDIEAGVEYPASMTISLPDAISNVDNCEVIVMVIDANTGAVINANKSKLVNGESGGSGVDEIAAGEADINIAAIDGRIVANGAQRVVAYSVEGHLLGIAEASNGQAVLNLEGYQGIVIAVAADQAGNKKTAKLNM